MIAGVSIVSATPAHLPQIAREFAGEDQTDYFPELLPDGEIPHPSWILQQRSHVGSRLLRLGELYQEMRERDGELGGLVRKRVKAVLGLPRFIDPADGSPRSLEIAEFCRAALAGVPSFSIPLGKLLFGLTEGVSHVEVIWGRGVGKLDGAWVPALLTDRPMWRLAYRLGPLRRGRRDAVLHVRRPTLNDVVPPPGKFIVLRTGTLDHPWGEALLDECYWPYYLTYHARTYWASLTERWAQPFVMAIYSGTLDGGTVPLKIRQDIEALIRGIRAESGGVIPKGVDLKLLEATQSGQATYESFIGSLNRIKALVILGEVDTSGMGKGPGSYAKSRVSDDVRLETVRIDAHELSVCIREQLLRPLVTLNFGIEDGLDRCPRFLVESEDVVDRKQRQEAAAAVLEAGQPIARSDYYRLHQVRQPRNDEDVVRSFAPRRRDQEVGGSQGPRSDRALELPERIAA